MIASRMNASAKALPNSPLLVSRVIAVVRIRVSPFTLQPTICDAPTSLITAPNPAITAPSTSRRDSRTSSHAACQRVAPSESSWVRSSGSRLCSAIAVRLMTAGTASRYCAITIPWRVQYQSRSPSAPLRHRNTTTNSPTTTGGRPMPVFTSERSSRRPRKRVRPISAPSGTPVTMAITVAAPLTTSDAKAASMTSGSRAASFAIAPPIPWRIRSIRLPGGVGLARVGEEELLTELVEAEARDEPLRAGVHEVVGERVRPGVVHLGELRRVHGDDVVVVEQRRVAAVDEVELQVGLLREVRRAV